MHVLRGRERSIYPFVSFHLFYKLHVQIINKYILYILCIYLEGERKKGGLVFVELSSLSWIWHFYFLLSLRRILSDGNIRNPSSTDFNKNVKI